MTKRPSRHIDEVVQAIDVGLQRNHNSILDVPESDCWRCVAAPGLERNRLGLCDSCFEEMKEWSK